MSVSKELNNEANKQKILNIYIFILFLFQPLLDVLSYWLIQWDTGTIITLALRTLLFATTVLFGFSMSKHRKAFCIIIGIIVFYWILHTANCFRIGHTDIYTDLNNYLRTVQAPAFALAFISIFKSNYKAFINAKKCMVINYIVILLVILLAAVTGTEPHTYGAYYKLGIIGWFFNGNSQTAIIAMIIPIFIYAAYSSKKKVFFLLAVLISFANLFFTGTRIAYYSIFIITIGFILSLLLTKSKLIYYYIIPIVAASLCAAFISFSPMHKKMTFHNNFVNEKQRITNENIKIDESELENRDDSPEILNKYEQLFSGLSRYQPMIEKFGLKAVLKQTDYTTNINKLLNVRLMKLNYNLLQWRQQDIFTKMFGMHYSMELCGNENYDLENDMLGILFLSGYVGFALYLVFIGYFVVIILKKLIMNFRETFSVELGSVIIGLCIAAITAVFTAGILRRPNASFYMSVLLAYSYMLINKYDNCICSNTGDKNL